MFRYIFFNPLKTAFFLLFANTYWLYSSNSHAINSFEINNLDSKLTHQAATMFTHLDWSRTHADHVAVNILPIKNFSGIPMALRVENSDYFNHGKIPQNIEALFSDLVNSSHYLITESALNHYQFQLSIDQYQLPYRYEPDDVWWKDLQGDVDRWLVAPENTQIALTLKIQTNRPTLLQWSRSIQITLSNCDINARTQPLLSLNNDSTMRGFITTLPGQAFIAASNFLILQSIYYINEKNNIAHVVNKNNHELFLHSEKQPFVIGEKLLLYHNNTYPTTSNLPAGQVKIIKTEQNQALAYPMNLRGDQIKVGDWVQMKSSTPYMKPKSIFQYKNKCESESSIVL